VAAGEFSAAQRHEIDRTIRAAEQSSRCEFSVFVGNAGDDPRAYARRLHGSLAAPDRSILLMVDPHTQVIEVVTGEEVRRTLSDAAVGLAVLQMQTAFAAEDLLGGLKRGVQMLAERARAPRTLHAEQ